MSKVNIIFNLYFIGIINKSLYHNKMRIYIIRHYIYFIIIQIIIRYKLF